MKRVWFNSVHRVCTMNIYLLHVAGNIFLKKKKKKKKKKRKGRSSQKMGACPEVQQPEG